MPLAPVSLPAPLTLLPVFVGVLAWRIGRDIEEIVDEVQERPQVLVATSMSWPTRM